MKHFQNEFIAIIFILGFVLLFLTANDFKIRMSDNIFESFSVEKIEQNSRTNQTQPVMKLNGEENEYEPKRIVFIKTHKTGSSTIQNIFYRYALGKIEFRRFCIPVTDLCIYKRNFHHVNLLIFGILAVSENPFHRSAILFMFYFLI